MQKYTLKEIKNFILSQDSLGDVLYNLNEENVERANDKDNLVQQLTEIRNDWSKNDFKEAYEDEWDDMDNMSLEDMKDRMEEVITHTYDISYIAQVIKDEA